MGRTMTVPSSKVSNSLSNSLLKLTASSNTFAVESPIVHIFVHPDSLFSVDFSFSEYSLSNVLFSETLEWVFGVTLSNISQSILEMYTENYSLCSDQTVETLMNPWPCRKLKIWGLLDIFSLERSSLSKYNQAAIWLHHILFQISCHGCRTFLYRIRSTAMHILQFEFFMCSCTTEFMHRLHHRF